ncbi:MAG: metallopeptidase family protein [Nocardiopsaceae bacterium]|nr:metallopeptidase family protein [Nocardiopsaceae bacterium]
MGNGENDAGPPRRVRRRDRHGRGLRGRLVPPGIPLYRTRSQQFDDMVLDAVARLEPRWGNELAGIEFAVQEVPDIDNLADEFGSLPLARVFPGSPGSGDSWGSPRPATTTRIVVYRRPLLARAQDDDELSDLVFDVVVEEFAELLGLAPESIDPSYREGGFD